MGTDSLQVRIKTISVGRGICLQRNGRTGCQNVRIAGGISRVDVIEFLRSAEPEREKEGNLRIIRKGSGGRAARCTQRPHERPSLGVTAEKSIGGAWSVLKGIPSEGIIENKAVLPLHGQRKPHSG